MRTASNMVIVISGNDTYLVFNYLQELVGLRDDVTT